MIMVAFAVILLGLQFSGDGLCIVGFLLIIAAMLYSPIKVFVIDRKNSA
ncbi:MAG: hypothetical protein LUF92_03065 [Clostridiales bacterium]|nr:hypothetical protein [Clostridiales bacterium]